jgi:hypothetical protein
MINYANLDLSCKQKLLVDWQDEFVCNLVDENHNTYSFNLEFLDIENPRDYEYIYIDNNLLNPNYGGYCYSLVFGDLESIYGRDNLSFNSEDVIMLETDDKHIFLKRLYG